MYKNRAKVLAAEVLFPREIRRCCWSNTPAYDQLRAMERLQGYRMGLSAVLQAGGNPETLRAYLKQHEDILGETKFYRTMSSPDLEVVISHLQVDFDERVVYRREKPPA